MKKGTLQEIYKPRLRAMERQCVYRMGDGCPCENQIDCRIPDALLIAEIALQLIDYQKRFEIPARTVGPPVGSHVPAGEDRDSSESNRWSIMKNIEHTIIGITRVDSGVFINCLLTANMHSMETRFKLRNHPRDLTELLALVACEIWSNDRGGVLIGNRFIGMRDGEMVLVLNDWRVVERIIREWKKQRTEARQRDPS